MSTKHLSIAGTLAALKQSPLGAPAETAMIMCDAAGARNPFGHCIDAAAGKA